MNALIVFAHPEPASFNGALRDTAASSLRSGGHSVEISDLYGENFDPVEKAAHYARRLDPQQFVPLAEQRSAGREGTLPVAVRREIARLERADLVIFQFPLWWHAQPAILKGWFDRVLVNGLLYDSTRRYGRGVFKGKRAVLSVTAGAPERSFGRGGRGGDIEKLLWPMQYSLH
ncbi:NAD(P)H-dependent oxidoreductase [Nitratireductor soli]|uniref:NAD(P)H-dependent oxidoreductase n=1 Tax=Nitratireductor soli TaxID=1670619 RepID=UPI000A979CFC|nr:NAD(P)H-dependent oxidoreductase [Nitratireductor soli]